VSFVQKRCQALSSNGRRCTGTFRVVAVNYHGNGEIYSHDGPEPKWVRVYLCPKHRDRALARLEKVSK
jgi:hypothetical protein